MPARVLVAYASKLGSTAEIAEAIAQTLRDSGYDAAAKPARDVMSLEGWDAVVLGSALYSAYWQRDARRFVERFRDQLKARPLWLFSGGPLDRRLAGEDQPITPDGAQLTAGLGARSHRTFGGRLLPDADVAPQVLADPPVRRLPRLAEDRRLWLPDRPRAGPDVVPPVRLTRCRQPFCESCRLTSSWIRSSRRLLARFHAQTPRTAGHSNVPTALTTPART